MKFTHPPNTTRLHRRQGTTTRKLTRSELDARVAELPSPTERQPLPEARDSPLLHDSGDGPPDGPPRRLHTSLDELDGVGEVHGEGRRGSSARHGFEEVGLPGLGERHGCMYRLEQRGRDGAGYGAMVPRG